VTLAFPRDKNWRGRGCGTNSIKGVSQQLLGAAFGCKVLAGKVAKLSESLGKEASDLAELVNEAVNELQSLVKSNQTER
jgi:hypothetical protein